MKNVAAVRAVEPDEAAEVTGLPDEVQVALSDIAQVAREGCWPCRCRRGWR